MNPFDRVQIGKIIRKRRREELGWSLDVVAKMSNDQLSKSTISNIERGYPGVSEEKIDILCRILGIPKQQIPELVQKDNIQHLRWSKKLARIEQMIDLIGPEQAYKKLKKIQFESSNPLNVHYYYLVGRCFYHKRQYEKAEEKFNLTLHLLSKFPEMEHTNIRSACYHELGRISYFMRSNLEQALHYTDQGLESFITEGERKIFKYILLSSKASYLEMMHRDEETMKTIELLLSEKDQWYHNIDVILNIFEIQANLAARQGYYDQALKYAEEGIELARSNKNYQRAVELITVLGNICNAKKDYEEAEEWYLFALQFKGRIKREYLLVSTLTNLGLLYMQLERWNEAKTILHEAVKSGEQNDDGIRYHQALVALGDYYLKTNNPKEAAIYYEKALYQAEKNDFEFIDPDLYAKLSHSWKNIDQEKSEKYFAKYVESKL